MTVNVYDVGDLARVTGTFTDVNGDVADPDTLTFSYENPQGTVTSYVYLTNAELVRQSEGIFYVDVSMTLVGDYHYRWIATGSGQGAQGGVFRVRPNFVQ